MRPFALAAAVLAVAAVVWLVQADKTPPRGPAMSSTPAHDDPAETVDAPPRSALPPDDPAGLRSSGLVVDEARRPVPGACVLVKSAEPPFAVYADDEGRFRLPAMRPPTVRLDVTAPGFAYSSGAIDLRHTTRTVVHLQRGATLAGVVRTGSGDAVPRAVIRVESNWRDYAVEADADGRYRIEKLAPGFFHAFTLSRAGRADQNARRPLTPLRAGETLAFDPVWRAGVTVSGVAAPGRTVTFGIVDSNRDSGTVPCDARGRFACRGVLPGIYLLHCYGKKISSNGRGHTGPDKVVLHVGTVDIADVRITIPGRATVRVKTAPGARSARVMSRGVSFHGDFGPDGTATVHVPACDRVFAWVGKARVGPFALEPGQVVERAAFSPPVKMTGVVLTPDGEPLPAASVRGEFGTAHTDAAGRFAVDLQAPVRTVVALHPLHAPGVARVTARNAAGLRIRMGRAHPIAGTVVDETGRPCAFADVRLGATSSNWDSFSFGRETNVEDLLQHGEPLAPRWETADAEGRFRFAHGAAGGFYLEAWHAGRTMESSWLRATDAPFQLVLEGTAATGVIKGIVVDEHGDVVRRAWVASGDAQDTTELHGLFELTGLVPGRYDIEVGQRPGFGERGFAKQIIRGVATGTDDLVIRVAAGPTLRGRVLDPDDSPVADAEAVFLEEKPTAPTPATRTGPDGTFELRGLADQPFDLAIFARGFVAKIHRTRPGNATFRLERGSALSGVLLDAKGDTVPGAPVRIQMTRAVDPAQLAPWTRRDQGYLPYFGAKTDAAGRFRIDGLLPGEYRLRAPNHVPASNFVAGQENIELRYRALRTIIGTVVDEDGAPVQGLRISAHFQHRQVGYVPIDADGRFRFEGVPDGKVSLDVVGNRTLKTTRVEVGPGAVSGVRIVMKPE